jgi:hypothetical protein
MPKSATIIEGLVGQYKLKLDGVEFWAPYWVNSRELMLAAVDTWVVGPYKGKGTPGQLTASLRNHLKKDDKHPVAADVYRQAMRGYGLGIDCSGFIYFVLDGYLRSLGKPGLRHHLIIPKQDILEAYDAKSSWRRYLKREEIEAQPELITLDWICTRVKKDPRMITNVARLVHPKTAHRIMHTAAIQPGDMIKMTSDEFGDHIGIVVSCDESEIVYAESTEPADALGGVGYNRISITSSGKPLEDQRWEQPRSYKPGKGNDGVWRLNVLRSA